MHKQAIERARLNILVSNTPFLLTVRQGQHEMVLYLFSPLFGNVRQTKGYRMKDGTFLKTDYNTTLIISIELDNET